MTRMLFHGFRMTRVFLAQLELGDFLCTGIEKVRASAGDATKLLDTKQRFPCCSCTLLDTTRSRCLAGAQLWALDLQAPA